MVDTLWRVPTTDVDPFADLRAPGSHGTTRAYLTSLWQRREYAWHVPLSELRSQQMNTVLGNLWHLLNPALSITVFYVIFGLVLKTTRGVDNFIAFLTVGMFTFQFTQKSTTTAAKSIHRNRGLLRSISFPRALLPISAVITEAMAFAMVIVVMFSTVLLSGSSIRWTWLLVVPLALLQLVFNVGLGMIVARATTVFRDIQNLLPFVFRLLFYASGVLFSVDAYLERESVKWLFILNPLFDIIELQRWAVLGNPITMAEFVTFVVWTVVIALGGFAWFRRAEATYGA